MKLIAGLGNPGRRYVRTPHNVGFEVVERLGRQWSCSLKRSLRFRARIGAAKQGEDKVLLLKPEAFMNNSGPVVAAVMRYRRLEPTDLVVVLDDADLEEGRIRVRPGGSSGGHRGLQSIIDCVGSDRFARVRIGVGRNDERGGLVDHVLRPYDKDGWGKMDAVIDRAGEAVLWVLRFGIEAAMNEYNSRNRE